MSYIMGKIICGIFFSLTMLILSLLFVIFTFFYGVEPYIQIISFFTSLICFYLFVNISKTAQDLVQERNNASNSSIIEEPLPKYEAIEMDSMLPEYTVIEI